MHRLQNAKAGHEARPSNLSTDRASDFGQRDLRHRTALAHDFGLSPLWFALSTVLVWAAPAQVILIAVIGAAQTSTVDSANHNGLKPKSWASAPMPI
jgi:hypothetical protein